MTIKRLSPLDWNVIEPILDSRKKFQNLPVDDDWHSRLKEYYVKRRLAVPTAFFFGYFVDDALVAVASFGMMPADGNYFVGASWTMAGIELPKWKDSRWPSALVELRHYFLDLLEPRHLQRVWTIRPSSKAWSTQAEVAGNYLSDATRYEKKLWGTVKAGTLPDEVMIRVLMVGSTLPSDQAVYTYDFLHAVPMPSFAPPETAPPPTEFTRHDLPPRGDVPTEHEPPPRG